MTEQEFLASDDPVVMLRHLRVLYEPGPVSEPGVLPVPLISDRKLRLFAVAAYRARPVTDADRDWPTFGRIALAAEAWADGRGCRADVIRAGASDLWLVARPDTAEAARRAAEEYRPPAALLRDVVGNPFRAVTLPPGPPCVKCGGSGTWWQRATRGYDCPGCKGTGHQPCPWLTPTVVSLATAAYEERGRPCWACEKGLVYSQTVGGYKSCTACGGTGTIDDGTLDPHRLAILSDALEEAGCGERSLLDHLHSGEPHVRGCFALDLLLGKE